MIWIFIVLVEIRIKMWTKKKLIHTHIHTYLSFVCDQFYNRTQITNENNNKLQTKMGLKFFFYSVVGWFQYLKRNAYFGIKYSICALQKLNPSQHPVFCHKWADQSLQEKKKPNSIRKTIYNYVLYFYGFVIIKIMKTTKKNESKRDL